MNKCEHCGIEYEAKRADSKTCSPKCKKALQRKGDTLNGTLKGTAAKGDNLKGTTIKGDIDVLTPDMLATLPDGVARPTGQPTLYTAQLDASQLQGKLVQMRQWQDSPEYAEIIYRLIEFPSDKLEDDAFIPCWKYQRELIQC